MKTANLKISLSVAMMLLTAPFAKAQVSHGGSPLFNHSESQVERVVLPTLDNDAYLQQDMNVAKGASPLRVGVMQDLHLSNEDGGTVTTLKDGTRVWRAAIESPNATFVTVHFSVYDIPEGAQLFFYDKSGDFVLGAFTKENTLDGGIFYCQAIPGSVAMIEYQEPASVAGEGKLVVNRVCHGYKDIFRQMEDDTKGRLGNADGTCHINVVCSDGNDWRKQIRSVVALNLVIGNYSYMCSGALVNNTRKDRTPYVLSAYHCQEDDAHATASSITTYFCYQTYNCSGTAAPTNMSITGFTELAKTPYSTGSDFFLLRLNGSIPDSYKPYYAGWDRSNDAPTVGCCIHHPGGDVKKISFNKSVSKMSGSYSKFLRVGWYTGSSNKGVTEQGSSGSPLFNSDKRIIGQLWSGSSACDYMAGTDNYGRVYSSWTGGGSRDTRLKDYLDPIYSNVSVLDGIDYDGTEEGIDMAETRELKVYPNPSRGMIYFDVPEIGMANYKVSDLSGRVVMEGRTVLSSDVQAVNLTGLHPGVYSMTLYTSANAYAHTIVISK